MNRDGNAHNLRLVSDKARKDGELDATFDPVEFIQALVTTLEPETVLGRLHEQLYRKLRHSGWSFTLEGSEATWSGGVADRHRVEYAIRFKGASLGSLVLMRGRRFTDEEQQHMEALLGLATPSLANALRFQRLLENLETDELTRLGNRRAFEKQGEKWLADCRRQGRPLSVLAIDLDYFKQINDRFGHPVGDKVLQRVADTLRASTRQSDLCVRMGGEEFLAILPGTDLSHAMECAERIRQAIAALHVSAAGVDEATPAGDDPIRITASVGVATIGRSTTLQAAYQAADEALYAAKRAGRNRILAGN